MTNLSNTEPPASPDYQAIKNKQNATWASGDYSKIGIMLQIVGEELAEAMKLTPEANALDVAAGNGNASLAMARRRYKVTSTDYVGDLLARGKARAEAEGLDIQFQVADAEALPFDDASFAGVVSTFGVMFAPNQRAAAAEMIRVCHPGGRIGLANWTPDGFIGALLTTIGGHVPPPAGLQSAARWGTRDFLQAEFGAAAASIDIELKQFNFRFPSAQVLVDFFRTWYGPVHKAFAALEGEQQKALEADMLALMARFNSASDGTAIIASDYFEVIITKA